MEKIFANVLDNEADDKYRRVKIASNTYQANVASVKHAEELMLQAGWRPQVRARAGGWSGGWSVGYAPLGCRRLFSGEVELKSGPSNNTRRDQ
jgi:hypothetical protein